MSKVIGVAAGERIVPRDVAHLEFFSLKRQVITDLRSRHGDIPERDVHVEESRTEVPGSRWLVHIRVRAEWRPDLTTAEIVVKDGHHMIPLRGQSSAEWIEHDGDPMTPFRCMGYPVEWCPDHQVVRMRKASREAIL